MKTIEQIKQAHQANDCILTNLVVTSFNGFKGRIYRDYNKAFRAIKNCKKHGTSFVLITDGTSEYKVGRC